MNALSNVLDQVVDQMTVNSQYKQPADVLADGKQSAVTCHLCDDAGHVLVYSPNSLVGKAQPCECGGMKRDPEKLLAACGVPDDEINLKLDFYQNRAGKSIPAQAVAGAIAAGSGLIYLHGVYGRGKSGMMKAAVLESCKAGNRAIYALMSDILDYERSKFGSADEKSASRREEQQRLGRLLSAKVLCIDEFDRVNNTEWVKEKVFGLIEKRYTSRQSKVTILASNTAPADLPPHLGYLVSRLRDATVMQVAGDDLRGPK